MTSYTLTTCHAIQIGPNDCQFGTGRWIKSQFYSPKWAQKGQKWIFLAFWPFGAPKCDLGEIFIKYESCKSIRRSIWHQVWHASMTGWRVWRIALWRAQYLPNANRPIWCAKTNIFFPSLAAHNFIVLGWRHFVQRIFCDGQKTPLPNVPLICANLAWAKNRFGIY